MEAWKVLAVLSATLVVFGIIVVGVDVPLSTPVTVGLLVVAAVASGLFYAVSRRGYRVGQQLGGDDDEG